MFKISFFFFSVKSLIFGRVFFRQSKITTQGFYFLCLNNVLDLIEFFKQWLDTDDTVWENNC